jgi:hypothetical protein
MLPQRFGALVVRLPTSFPLSLPSARLFPHPPSSFSASIRESEAPHTTFITASIVAYPVDEGRREGGRGGGGEDRAHQWSAQAISDDAGLREV